MLNLSSYAFNTDVDLVDYSSDFFVNSCGHYKLLTFPRFDTVRPAGRADYEILYVAQGAGHFLMDGTEQAVQQGQLVVYRPWQPQVFHYLLADNPDVYWLHFTGRNAAGLLEKLGLLSGGIHEIHGFSGQFTDLFDQILRELQLQEEHHLQIASLLGQQLLFLLGRGLQAISKGDPARQRMQEIISYMYRDYQHPLSTQDYANRLQMSKCWFIRSFKEATGVPPLHFLTSIRIEKSKELLESSPYNVSEIAEMVGYDNPLYFSRLFKRKTGVSPLQYRKHAHKATERTSSPQ